MPHFVAILPSVRKFPLEYLMELSHTDIIIIDDKPTGRMMDELKQPDWHRADWLVVDHSTRDKILPPIMQAIVPKQSPSCKNIGLYMANRYGYEIAILLDDDCDTRVTKNFIENIPINKVGLYRKVVNRECGNPLWYNPMNTIDQKQYSRGFPYHERSDKYKLTADTNPIPVIPKFNEGLWKNTPDTNGVDKFYKDNSDWIIAQNPDYNVVLDQNIYVPISIMNIHMDTSLIPAFYQPPDWHIYDQFYIKRHDDVWSGMFLKRLMDLVGDAFTIGSPVIFHDKIPVPQKETVAEHVTNFAQTELQKVMDRAIGYVKPGSYIDMAIQFSSACRRVIINSFDIHYQSILMDYFSRTKAWAEQFA